MTDAPSAAPHQFSAEPETPSDRFLPFNSLSRRTRTLDSISLAPDRVGKNLQIRHSSHSSTLFHGFGGVVAACNDMSLPVTRTADRAKRWRSRQRGLGAYNPAAQLTPPLSPGGGIGRRTALRWQRVTSCRFKSCPGHEKPRSQGDAAFLCVPSMFDSSGCESRSNLMEVKDSRPQGRRREACV